MIENILSKDLVFFLYQIEVSLHYKRLILIIIF